MDKQELSDFLAKKGLSGQTPKEEQDKISKEALTKIDDSYEKYSKQTIAASCVLHKNRHHHWHFPDSIFLFN